MERLKAKVDGGRVRVDGEKRGFDSVLAGRGDTLGSALGPDPLGLQLDTGNSGGATDPLAVAHRGVAGASSPLPHLGAIQKAFGKHDVTGARATVGGPARDATDALGANAYATGNRAGFGSAPSLHTAAHEAAHLVQQQHGVQLAGGLGHSGDTYEQHADQVADAVVAGRSAEGLLDQKAGGSGQKGATRGSGLQRELKRSKVEKADLALEGPAFGVPGLKWAVKAEGEREVEDAILGGKPETTVKASLAGGLKYSLYFLELGVDLTADVEVKVEGNETTGEALHRGVREFARWYAASRLGDVAQQRARLQTEFATARSEILAAYRELGDLLKTSGFKDFKTGATSWFYFTQSPRAKAGLAVDLLHQAIGELFDVAGANSGAINAAKQFVDKNALLGDFASAADTDEKNATRAIDRSRTKFLQRFDPARAQLLGAFDGLDAAKMLERDKAVSFSGTFGAQLSGKYGWGGSGEEHDNEVEVAVGVGKRIQSGEDDRFELGTQDVLRGKAALKLSKWGVEVKAERQLTKGDGHQEKVRWKIEVEGKRTGLLDEDKAEEVIDALEVGVGGVARSGALPDTCDIPTTLDHLTNAMHAPVDKAEGMVAKGETGAEVAAGGEVEIEHERHGASAPWQRSKLAGKVAVSGFAGVKGGLDLGSASKLAKVEGGITRGYKLSKSFG